MPTFIDIVPFLINIVPTNNLFLWGKQSYLVCPVRAGPGNIGVDRGRADNGQTFLDKDGNREVKDGRGEFKQICL